MTQQTPLLIEARKLLENANKNLEEVTATWSEAVTNLHMAELKLKKAQRAMRDAYGVLAEVLNGELVK